MATYFDDCSALTDWADAGIAVGAFSVSAGEISSPASSLECLEYTPVNSDANRQDFEILIKVKVTSISTTHYVAIGRGSDSDGAGSASGYLVAIRSSALRTYKKVSGAFTQITTASATFSSDTYRYVRFRVNGSSIKAHVNDDGAVPGGTWTCEGTDTDISSTLDGYVGLQGSNAATTQVYDLIGIGTNGDTAPSSGSTGITGSLSVTLADVTVSASGALSIAGSASNTLAAVGLSGAGAVAIAGSASNTLAAATLSASGSVLSGVTGDLAQTLAAATLAGSGAVAITGSLAQTLVAAALSGAGAVAIQGAAANTLGGVSLSAQGYVGSTPITGSLAQTLGAVTASGAGQISIAGALAQTLGAASLSAAGTVALAGVIGALDQQLGAVGLSAAGALPITGAASVQLGAASLLSSGAVLITGALAQALAPLSISARGGETVIVVGALVGLLRAYPALAAAIDLDPALEATIAINQG